MHWGTRMFVQGAEQSALKEQVTLLAKAVDVFGVNCPGRSGSSSSKIDAGNKRRMVVSTR